MTDDEFEETKPILTLVPPPPDPMRERGARPIDPPGAERPQIGDPSVSELSVLIRQVINIRGAQKKDLVPHWLAVDVMKIIDPHRLAPDLVRMATLTVLRDLATQTMRAYRPPDDALKQIEAEEAAYARRIAAEDIAAALARRLPANCGMCGKSCAEDQRSLIIGDRPKTRVCEMCIGTAVVDALDRHWRRVAAEEAQARETAKDGVSRQEQRQWERALAQSYSLSRRRRGEQSD